MSWDAFLFCLGLVLLLVVLLVNYRLHRRIKRMSQLTHDRRLQAAREIDEWRQRATR